MDVERRVGDRERQAVDERLQDAVGDGVLSLHEYEERAALVWAARTRAELDPVVADLPEAAAPAPAPDPGAALPPRRSVAVMGGDELRGPVLPGQEVQAYAVMGGTEIDLRRADLPAEVTVRAVAVMGGVEVLVPRGVRVELHGAAFMGGRSVRVDDPVSGAPVVHVHAWALMGGVDVRHEGDASVAAAVEHATAAATARVAGRAAPRARSTRSRLAGVLAGAAAVVAVAGGLVAADRATDELAVFGNGFVSLTYGETVVLGAAFGSVEVRVPSDAQVEIGGVRVFASAEDERNATCSGGPCQDVIEVDAYAVFGNVEIVPVPPPASP